MKQTIYRARFAKSPSRPNPRRAGLVAGLTAVIGIAVVVRIFAAGTPIAFEAETGSRAGAAALTTTTGASGTGAVKFGAATPTPTVAPTPTPSPTSGWPTTANTGWQPTGVTLAAYSGDKTISVAGTVLDGQDLGCITVTASNVTIKRSRISCSGGYWGIRQVGGVTGFTLTDSEIRRTPGTANNVDDLVSILGGNVSLLRNSLHDGSTGFQIAASDVLVQDNYVWDQKDISGLDHVDALLDNGGTSNVTIRHNNLEVNWGQTSPLALYNDAYTGGGQHNTIVDNNLLNGGGYCAYVGGSDSTGIQFTNNHFGRKFYSTCGSYGPVHAGWNISPSSGNSWSGNVWDDTGQTIPAPTS